MNPQVAERTDAHVERGCTSALGAMGASRQTPTTGVWRWPQYGTALVSAGLMVMWLRAISLQRTSSGARIDVVPAKAEEAGPGEALMELRRLAGLTFEELARLFGVSRRALHYWVSGKSPSAGQVERIYRALSYMRSVDRGTAVANRRLLWTSHNRGPAPFDLLMDAKYDQLPSFFGSGQVPARARRTPLGKDELLARNPPSPVDLIQARHDPIQDAAEPARLVRGGEAK